MKRTLVQLDEVTYRRLRQRAYQQERSMSAVVRELLARGLDARAGRESSAPPRRFLSVGAGRSTQDAAAPVSEHHDRALTKAFDS